ncbi:PREDICTED: uncharacterized protein LOC107353814 [Acropora digitifera]|uniref:uncharacterized protein LOC107353814 n=1 Tax=Acropora digitifera TaxID=70779 RepID=UPI00077A3886|nr:PREDICTED: uncharacterized protein LOC107353814 [Acropora digitifera]
MGQRKFHCGQFSGEYQPAKKVKTKEEENEKRSNISFEGSSIDSSRPKDFLKAVNELEKIKKLSRDCKRLTTENANLKRTIQTLRKSLIFLKRKNIDLIRENLSLKKRVTRKKNYIKITSLKKKEITNKLRGAKSATTKLKNQLKEKLKVVNTKYSLADTFAHGNGKSNGRTTAAARDIHERRIRAYGQLLNTELLQEARKNLEKIQKGNVDSGPLTAKDAYTKAWEEKKPNKQMSTIIKSLKDEGRKLELLWKASTKGTIYLEEQRCPVECF